MAEQIAFVLGVGILTLGQLPALGVIVPALTILFTFALALLAHRAIAEHWRSAIWLVFPMFAVASMLWSPNAALTGNYALQFVLTMSWGLLLSLALPPRSFVRCIFSAGLIACLICLQSGIMGPSVKGLVLIGYTGSKDAIAATASLCLIAAIAILAEGMSRSAWTWKLVSLLALPLMLYIIATSQAATHIILTVAAAGIYLFSAIIRPLPIPVRNMMLILALLFSAIGAVFYTEIRESTSDYILTTFNKDKTLTGRTYLWDVANELSARHPTLGWGYKFIWNSYSTEAIGMLRSQNVTDPRTFGVHHTFLDARVDLGMVGEAILILTLIAGTGLVALRYWTYIDPVNSFFLICAVTFVARMFAENIFGPFYIFGAVLLATYNYAMLGGANRRPSL